MLKNTCSSKLILCTRLVGRGPTLDANVERTFASRVGPRPTSTRHNKWSPITSIDAVKGMLLEGLTYKEISQELKCLRGGLSERSVRRFVKNNGIKEEAKTEQRNVVRESIREVSKAYSVLNPM